MNLLIRNPDERFGMEEIFNSDFIKNALKNNIVELEIMN